MNTKNVAILNLITISISISLFSMEKCDKYIQELKNVRYSTSNLEEPLLSRALQQQEILVTGWQEITKEIARKDAKIASLTQDIQNRTCDTRYNTPFTARIHQERFDKNQAEFKMFIDAIAEKDTEIATLKEQLRQPRILRQQLEEAQQQNSQELMQLRERVDALVASEKQVQQESQALHNMLSQARAQLQEKTNVATAKDATIIKLEAALIAQKDSMLAQLQQRKSAAIDDNSHCLERKYYGLENK